MHTALLVGFDFPEWHLTKLNAYCTACWFWFSRMTWWISCDFNCRHITQVEPRLQKLALLLSTGLSGGYAEHAPCVVWCFSVLCGFVLSVPSCFCFCRPTIDPRHAHKQVQWCTCIGLLMQARLHVCMCVHAHTYTHIFVHVVYMHTHTCTYFSVCVSSFF